MSNERFTPTDSWPLQGIHKRELHETIQDWGVRVVPYIQELPLDEQQPRQQFLEFLLTSVERDDSKTALTVQAINEYVKAYVEGPGPYGRGGGSIDSVAGIKMCQSHFEGLYSIYEAGRQSVK